MQCCRASTYFNKFLGKLLRHIFAFANTPRRTSAFVIFGVRENKSERFFEHVGIPTPDAFPNQEKLEQIIRSHTNLRDVVVDTHFVLDGKRTPYVAIPLQFDGPYVLPRAINAATLEPQVVFRRYGSSSARANERDVLRMKSDWGSWFLDCRYEKEPADLINALSARFPTRIALRNTGRFVKLVYLSETTDELGSHNVPGLIHAYWGFAPVQFSAVDAILADTEHAVSRRTLLASTFSIEAEKRAAEIAVRCVSLDELYFVNDPYAQLCREFLKYWHIERTSRNLSFVVDLDFYASGFSTLNEERESIRTFLENELKRHDGRAAVVVHGDFGCGKTVTAKQLVADMAEEYLKGTPGVPRVLYVDVNNMDIRSRRDECIRSQIGHYKLDYQHVERLLAEVNADKIQLVFDGVDEMARPYTSEGRRAGIELLRDVANRRTAVYFIRSSYYPDLSAMIGDFGLLSDVDFATTERKVIVAEIRSLRNTQVNDYLEARLGVDTAREVVKSLEKHDLGAFLSDPLMISFVADVVEEFGAGELLSFPKTTQKVRFLSNLVSKLLNREQSKRQRHKAYLTENFDLFQGILRSVAFGMVCRGNNSILPAQLEQIVIRAVGDESHDPKELVDSFRTMSWIHRTDDGGLSFRQEALTLLCASQHICTAFASRDVAAVEGWKVDATVAPVVCGYAGENLRAESVLGATVMLGSGLRLINVRQLMTDVLERCVIEDLQLPSKFDLSDGVIAAACRGIATYPSLSRPALQVLLHNLKDKRTLQITLPLLWSFSKSYNASVDHLVVDLLGPRIKRGYDLIDDLRRISDDRSSYIDKLLLKELSISVRDLMDSLSYEKLFQRIKENSAIELPLRQFADRTLRGIEGEQRRRIAAMKQS